MKRRVGVVPSFRFHFGECANFYIVVIAFFCLGLIFGFFHQSKLAVIMIFSGSFWQAFMDSFFISVLLIGVAFSLNLVIYTMPLSFGVIVFRGYVLARNTLMLFSLFKMTGVLYAVLFYIPLMLAVNAFIIVALVLQIRRNLFCCRNRLHFTSDLKETAVLLALPVLGIFAVAVVYSTFNVILYSLIIVVKI